MSGSKIFHSNINPPSHSQWNSLSNRTCFYIRKPNNISSVCYLCNVTDMWVPEISHHCTKTPYIIVGTDLRTDTDIKDRLAERKQTIIQQEQGKKLAKELKAVKYVECSALTQSGLKNVFDKAILATLKKPEKIKNKCNVI